jgi:hypothetical protein
MVSNVLIMLIQAAFAGRMLGGDGQSANLHEFTAKVLVLLTCAQFILAISLKFNGGCPAWIPTASGALLIAEVLEFAAGHFHHVAFHVPLGLAIFGGVVRQAIWAMRESNLVSESRA